MDGISSMAVTASASKEYGPHLFIPSKEVSFLERLFLRVMAPFAAILLMKNMLNQRDRNVFTKGKNKMTGKVHAASSRVMDLGQIKMLSKVNGVTINDVIMASMSSAFHRYLGLSDDNCLLNILIPANIRFKFYEKYEDIKIENKFSGLPVTMPLIKNMSEAFTKIGRITKRIKSSFVNIYCSYAVTYWTTKLVPRSLPRLFLHNASMQFTCSFSNVPGPLKYIEIDDKYGNKGFIKEMYPYVIVSGRVGMCISCVSLGPGFHIALTCDEAICPDPERIIAYMEEALDKELAALEDNKKTK